ncbi:hypothetical protein RSOLAG1IB_03054 [Rhizoctonia solani AG-1 IB]|uniref:Uncharacterized protein n=1 Tax=Thanatephorus cucumeris (strain AG1-IB / isolate 7/3/14) TaxID=1108050 RepID=A0A0B7FQ06_THACB|nr:hypothetical protein RSOLAG1IB_03054 [Rhizoctonia solani AG-1 IB]
MPAGTSASTSTSTSTMQPSPRNKKLAGPPPVSGIAQAQNKRPSLRYSLNHLGKALADAVGKESKSSAHIRSASAIPSSLVDRSGSSTPSTRPSSGLARRPSIAGAFERPSLDAVKPPQSTISPKRASPPKPTQPPPTTAPTVQPLVRRRSFMVKGALNAPSTTSLATPNAPVPVGTAKLTIRPKMSAPPRVTTEDERPIEVKERRTDSPRGPPVAAFNRTRERVDSRASPVRLPLPTSKGRASPIRNDQTPTATPKDDRAQRRERREKEKQAAEAAEREKKAALERERAKVAEARKEPSGHRTSGSTATLTSASSIFTSISRSSTGESHTSGGASTKPKSNTAVFPRAAQTVVLTPPDDDEEYDEDATLQTPMTRSRTATGSTHLGEVSSPAISRTLLASISAQTESPIMAPLDRRLRHAGSFTSLNSSLPSSTLPSPVHPGTVKFPPPAPGLKGRGNTSDDEESEDEGDVSALLETVISPLKGQATPAMPRFTSSKSKSSSRPQAPETPSRTTGLPGRDELSYVSPALPAVVPVPRTKGEKPGKDRLNATHRGPRESILSYDALVERSRLEEDDLEDMLRAPPPAVGLISPDMRPARNLPRLTTIGPKRMNLGLGGMSDSEAEIEEEAEEQTVHVPAGGQSISQVLFPIPGPSNSSSPIRERKNSKLAEKERLWMAKEEAWKLERAEWETERARWETERAQWEVQQAHWNSQRTQWNTQQSAWSGQQTQWETERAGWTARELEFKSAVLARDQDIEALEQETGAHVAEMHQRSEEHRLEIEALLKRIDGFAQQSQELKSAKEREAKFDAQLRCTSALNAWTGVCASLRADAASRDVSEWEAE